MIRAIPFGKTGHNSTRTIFGAAALGSASHDEADSALELLQRCGVNHIDVAASYGDAELRSGPWIVPAPHRILLGHKDENRAQLDNRVSAMFPSRRPS